MSLTDKQLNAYIESGGTHCPFCGAPDIEGRFVEIDAGRAPQSMSYVACKRAWTDRYTLTDVIPAE